MKNNIQIEGITLNLETISIIKDWQAKFSGDIYIERVIDQLSNLSGLLLENWDNISTDDHDIKNSLTLIHSLQTDLKKFIPKND